MHISHCDNSEIVTPDYDRKARQGHGEVIYGASKSAEQIAYIISDLNKNGQSPILATRIDSTKAQAIEQLLNPELNSLCTYYADAQCIVCGDFPAEDGNGTVVVACAGTSDISVAEEAAVTLRTLGNHVERLYDVGVAGIHRLLEHKEKLQSAQVIVAIAGMEGALPSVIGGLVSCPVIAVPTSVGYGANLDGITALLAMLNSCASGVSVVNIDNGFGAAYQASLINHLSIES